MLGILTAVAAAVVGRVVARVDRARTATPLGGCFPAGPSIIFHIFSNGIELEVGNVYNALRVLFRWVYSCSVEYDLLFCGTTTTTYHCDMK